MTPHTPQKKARPRKQRKSKARTAAIAAFQKGLDRLSDILSSYKFATSSAGTIQATAETLAKLANDYDDLDGHPKCFVCQDTGMRETMGGHDVKCTYCPK